MDKDEKFDRFIEDFDRKLNTDTSTYKTILTRPTSPPADNTRISGPQSPLLTTPTKARRNSISPEKAPLSGPIDKDTRNSQPSPRHMELKPSTTESPSAPASSHRLQNDQQQQHQQQNASSPGVRQVRLTGSAGGLKRSNTISGGLTTNISSVHRQPSTRRGLNLGLNLKRTEGAPVHSQRQPGSLRSPEILTPSQETSKRLTSPNTDTKSRQYNAQTPSNRRTPMLGTQAASNAADTPVPSKTSPSHQFATPSTTSNPDLRRTRRNTNTSVVSEYDDVDDSLRMLAAKEMKVAEMKHKLKMLQQEIDFEEQELKKLRDKVGNTIYKGISPQHNHTKILAKSNASSSNTPKNDPSKKESIWTRPVNFLNQFDQLLQTEIERINKEGFKHPNEAAADSQSGGFWSFVNEVKQGLLGEDDSPTRDKSTRDNESETEGMPEQEMITIREH
ncbi:CYFA0S06e03686g1_1 [Cyberlindnera fabianii]|uniref:CYFA0S06e03686g1_1 n=1 Tax=Cyberlindnera fabianii TaxID=36022 RepID=A0A061AU83_CYBFA|nr:Topoisomerase I damage affected protein 11 [Cyberlindnera fabianii]CDR41196.1 CYFA0S06e03686g1_1 [Cyberlindnera fabianii]